MDGLICVENAVTSETCVCDADWWCLQPIDDSRTLGEVGFTSSTAKAQTPATVGLVFKQDGKPFLSHPSV